MRILIKYPTRGRPKQFLETLRGWAYNADDLSLIKWLISYDDDDKTMSEGTVYDALALVKNENMVCIRGKSLTKIQACNADFDMTGNDWGAVLLVSDDMISTRKGWDTIIRQKMTELYPDTDGCLWFHDGSKQRVISTLSCMGKKYYDRFGYLYHPSYSSFFCDNEYTDIARSLNKITFIEQGICTHFHPAWQRGIQTDAVYLKNNKYWKIDQATYNKRKAEGFPK